MGTFDISHHVHLNNKTYGLGAYKRTEPTDVAARDASARPWSRDLATCHGHTCHYNIRGEVYDHEPPHGLHYVGKAIYEREAVAIWKNYLLTIGVPAEDAEVGDLP